MSCKSPKTAVKRLRGKRTYESIKQRRYKLRHLQERTAQPVVGRKRIWTLQEERIVKKVWPTISHVKEIRHLLPRFTDAQIREKAAHLGVKRRFLGNGDCPVDGDLELVDQIRIRAKQDGLTLRALDQELKSGNYFQYNWKRYRQVNLRKVADAITLFGGTLVIDWRDR